MVGTSTQNFAPFDANRQNAQHFPSQGSRHSLIRPTIFQTYLQDENCPAASQLLLAEKDNCHIRSLDHPTFFIYFHHVGRPFFFWTSVRLINNKMAADNGDFSQVLCRGPLYLTGRSSWTSPTVGTPAIVIKSATLRATGALHATGVCIQVNGVNYVLPLYEGA